MKRAYMPFSFYAKNTCPIMKGNNKIKGDVSMKKITEIVKDNNEYRPSYALNYKTPVEYRTQLGFP